MSRPKKEKSFSFPISTLAGSKFDNFINSSKGFPIGRRLRFRYFLSGLVSFILTFFSWGETLLWRNKVRKQNITKPPVFIIGFWRSGTTYLHNLMCLNPEFAYVSTFQTIFPHHALTHAGWMKMLAKFLMPEKRPVDNVKLDMELPQEEEIGLANISTISLYHYFYFPQEFEIIKDRSLYFKNISPERIDLWKHQYEQMIKKAMLNKKAERFISKNPPNTARIKVLLEMFPDAKFIYIYRDPYKVMQSTADFFKAVINGIQFQEYEADVIDAHLQQTFKMLVNKYETDKSMISKENLLEIKYEDFVKDPIGHLQEIYKQFGLGDFEDQVPAIESFISLQKYESRSYQIDQKNIDFINEQLSQLLEEGNYKKKNNN